MNYFFPADLSHSFSGQPPRSPLMKPSSHNSFFPSTQEPIFSYFPQYSAKSNYLPEDPYFTPISQPSTDYSAPYDLQTFDALQSPAPYQSIPNNSKFHTSFNFTLDSELPTFEPFKEQNTQRNQTFSVDNFFNSQEEIPLENLSNPLEDAFDFQSDLFSDEKDFESTQGSPQTFSSPSEGMETSEKSYNARPDMKGWCEEDEKLLRKLAVQYKFDWKKIAKKFTNKKYTPHFLKMRFKGNDEGPVPKRVKFTHEEDVMIAKYFDTYGVDWDKIVEHFPNRTAIMIKNRFYSYIRKNNRLENLLQESGQRMADEENVNKELSEEAECFNFEMNGVSMNENNGKNMDENALLRAQLKSLKSLYLVTFRELSKLKKESGKKIN
jgi:hypothetical protein